MTKLMKHRLFWPMFSLVALIALVAIVGLTATGTSLNAQFAKISCKIATPTADCTQTQ